MRVPPPGDVTPSDRAIDELRRRLSYDATERRGRYYAAMVSGPSSLEAVLRLVDAELEQVRAERANRNDVWAAVERAIDLATQWETLEPSGLMSRTRASAILLEVLQPFTPRPTT